jgi:hypothetical protein
MRASHSSSNTSRDATLRLASVCILPLCCRGPGVPPARIRCLTSIRCAHNLTPGPLAHES